MFDDEKFPDSTSIRKMQTAYSYSIKNLSYDKSLKYDYNIGLFAQLLAMEKRANVRKGIIKLIEEEKQDFLEYANWLKLNLVSKNEKIDANEPAMAVLLNEIEFLMFILDKLKIKNNDCITNFLIKRLKFIKNIICVFKS